MTDLEHKKKRCEKLEAGNDRSYKELREAVGGAGFEMNTADARRELFFEKMVEWGVVTEEQMIDFNIAFHEKVEEALTHAWEEFRKVNKPKLTVAKRSTKLVDGQGRPLT